MLARITVSTILIFLLIVARQLVSFLYCSTSLVVVTWVCKFHFNEGTTCKPRYSMVRFGEGLEVVEFYS